MNQNNIVALLDNTEVQDFFGHNGSQNDVNFVFSNGSTFLTMAVRSGNLEYVKSAINKRPQIDKSEVGGATPLLLAVHLNRPKIVEFLVLKGASVNLGDSYETPIMVATRKGFLKTIEFLVTSGAHINTPNIEGISPLFWAIRERKLAVLEKLISKGIPAGTRNPAGSSPLMYAVQQGCSREIIQCLLKNGANVNESPLAWAAKTGDLEVVDVLIKYGADCNQIGPDGNTPLATAVRHQQNKIVEYLVGHNVNLCKVGKNGKTPLLWSVENGDFDLVEYLLDHGANYIIDSVFLKAIDTRNLEIVKFLHQRGAYKNKKYTINEATPLAKALQVGSYEIAKYLLENGSTLDDLEDHDVLYLMKFLDKKHYQMVKLLVENGTRLQKTSSQTEHTPLTKAVHMEDFEMVKYFVENNANVNQPNGKNKTPLNVAAEVKNFRIFQFLVDKGANIDNDPLKLDETMRRYYDIAVEYIVKREALRSELFGNQEAADEVQEEEEVVGNSACDDEVEVKEKSLAEKNYYVLEFD